MAQTTPMAVGSLAEHLYSYFTLPEVQKLLTKTPQSYELIAWDLAMDEYVQQINCAIEFIQCD